MNQPIICFGQQPNGIFPKRFLIAKINTARRLQKELGGKIVYFYHDSDADYRETVTLMRDRQTDAEVRLNFTQENKIQKKFSPLYAKRVPAGWKEETLKQLPRFLDQPLIDLFKANDETMAADFCLKMYKKLGLLDGIEVMRSGDPKFREQASDLAADYFADLEYQGEIVRARIESAGVVQASGLPRSQQPDGLHYTAILHEGGQKFISFPIKQPITKSQKSAGADQRFAWMNSVIRCTHYVYGEGEADYLKFADFPEVKFTPRDKIADPNFAWLPSPDGHHLGD